MGTLEKKSKTRHRRGQVQQVVLQCLFAAGVLSVAGLAPNALQMLSALDVGPVRKMKPEYRIRQAVRRLEKQDLVVFEKAERGRFLRLTGKGEHYFKQTYSGSFLPLRPKRWDKRWRVLTFDIGEKRRRSRDLLRRSLQEVGFLRLHDSVWVYPYDCEDYVVMLKAEFKLGNELLYMIADTIENDTRLRDHFNL